MLMSSMKLGWSRLYVSLRPFHLLLIYIIYIFLYDRMDRDSQTVLAHEFSYVLSLTTRILDDMLCQPPTAKDFVNRHKAAVSVIRSAGWAPWRGLVRRRVLSRVRQLKMMIKMVIKMIMLMMSQLVSLTSWLVLKHKPMKCFLMLSDSPLKNGTVEETYGNDDHAINQPERHWV